jgi:hypothetical protein
LATETSLSAGADIVWLRDDFRLDDQPSTEAAAARIPSPSWTMPSPAPARSRRSRWFEAAERPQGIDETPRWRGSRGFAEDGQKRGDARVVTVCG